MLTDERLRAARQASHALQAEGYLARATALAQEAAAEPLPQRRAVLLAAADRLARLAGHELPATAGGR
ncbi:MAG TPA: hypothetical protein VGD44_04285 [Phenylobacterium sp.]